MWSIAWVSEFTIALCPKLIGTSKRRNRDTTFYEIQTKYGPSAAKIRDPGYNAKAEVKI